MTEQNDWVTTDGVTLVTTATGIYIDGEYLEDTEAPNA